MTRMEDRLRQELRKEAESCSVTVEPAARIVALARNFRRSRLRRRRSTAAAALVSIVALVTGNVAVASETPATVPSAPPADSASPTGSGPYTAVAILHPKDAPSQTLWIAGDSSGKANGCVSLTATGATPSPQLPSTPSQADPSALCSFAGDNGGPAQVGYGITLDRESEVLAYGFVPASAVEVTLTMKKRGLIIFRLLKPTVTVEATLHGGTLGLPIKAWQGPDPSGYSVKRIEARDDDGNVVARLTFGD